MAVNIPDRNFDDIINDSKNYLIQNSKIKNVNRTSTAKLLLDAVAFEQENLYNFQRSQFLNSYLSTATGPYLEEFGILLSEVRKTPQKSTDTSNNNFRFYVDPTFGGDIQDLIREFYTPAEITELINAGLSTDGSDIIIPTNVRITNLDETIVYFTDNPVTIRNSTEGYSPISAESTGDQYNISPNVLILHNIADIPELRKIANLILAENKFGVANGESFEDDDNYRWRLSNKIVSNSNANETAIRAAAFLVPGVRAVTIVPKVYGTGTFRVFVEGINPIVTDGLLNAVKESIQRQSAVGENVYVTHPNYVGIEMQIQCRFDFNANRNLLKESVRTVVIDYINNLDIGGEIIINEMIQRILNISSQIQDLNFVLFGIGEYNRITNVNENFTPLRVTNQTAKWNEKFYTNNQLATICEFGALE